MSITSTSEYTIPGAHVTDRTLTVPLDWAAPDDDRTLSVFVREVVAPRRRSEDLPLLVFLQGGPGGKGPRPTGPDGWLGEALKRFRVVLLDQRGTGRSTAVRASALTALGSPEVQAEHLSHFRADSIVLDAEHVRREVYDGRRWSTLGQSYGGFLTLTYLSLAPEGVAASYVTGGLAGLTASADDVYGRTQPRVVAKNEEYRRRYPADVERIGRIADRLAAGDVRLPGGDLLSVERFQSLGMAFGMGPGFERVHWIVDEAFDDGTPGREEELTDTFLAEVESATGFATNPLYAVLHESIYAQASTGPTAWAAQRVRDGEPAFDTSARPLLFTGEMIYPWMFEQVSALRPFRDAAEALATRDGWRDLYDLDVLAANAVPLEAAVYHDDMFVDAGCSLETTSRVGNARAWVTNEFEHDGLRAGDVFTKLVDRLDARGGPLHEPAEVRSFGWFAYAPESGGTFVPDVPPVDGDGYGNINGDEAPADTPAEPPSPRPPYEVRLMNEYSCDWPLWSNLPPRVEAGLDDTLQTRLRAWAATFQEHFDPFDAWDDATVATEHRTEGERLREALQAALPWPWSVRLDAWEHRAG